MALEGLSNDVFARVIRVTRVQPIPGSNLPTPILNLLHGLPGLVETRNVVTALEVSPSAAFKGLTVLGPAGREVEFVVAL